MRWQIAFFTNLDAGAWRLLAIAFALFAGAATILSPDTPNCAIVAPVAVQTREAYGPTFGKDLADTAEARTYRAAWFDVPTAEDVARQGGRTVRIVVEPGRGGMLPLMSLETTAGGGARLVARTSVKTGGEVHRVTRAYDVSRPAYDALSRQAARLFRTALLTPPAPQPDPKAPQTLVICMDGPTTVMEITAPGLVQRATEYCGDLGLQEFANRLAAYALAKTPGCGAVEAYIDTPLDRLRLCLWVEGDRAPAVAVMNLVLNADLDAHPTLADQAAASIEFVGPDGRAVAGAAAFRDAWADLVDKADARFYFAGARGLSASRVVVRGTLSAYAHPGDQERRSAASTQTWERIGGRWRLTRWVVDSIDAPPPPR